MGTRIISLIGMTGVGKTTVGVELAKRLQCRFSDLDVVITENENRTPREIFDTCGEDKFRLIESRELRKIICNFMSSESENQKLILSCGGGVVLRDENRELLKKYSYVVWLDRPIEEIEKNDEVMSRPPVNGEINNYIKLKKERESLYSAVCSTKIEYTAADEACDKIIAEITARGLI